ncbi:GreA/GreB family elongation factor [Thalassotalea sediminis]|uniref:GreA/GreB family elongation factor n=1 Tax=Thalassotalea sediminis TaxID=1759089 RepID=UPI00257288C0|nr:GreA/GreB family elongation factor [Thalassotalea sediminis]
MPNTIKMTVKQALLDNLKLILNDVKQAAEKAHLAAIDEQSVAETQYDTLAIEAAYLAEGYSRRINELSQAITLVSHLSVEQTETIQLGALVKLAGQSVDYFIAPAGAGITFTIESINIAVLSPQSPIGKAMLSHEAGDVITVTINQKEVVYEVIDVQ